ncbi:response regulator transcription factor [Clostridium tertium]|uniref:Stage 0 sporulation protein A homolog n=1 Tax=Clostridium tertium TaxID=1559 RepID=A0A9X3XG64_9CLOT|nr:MULTISPECIES: response regulator transcription factor [Clostridium]MDB1947014.1 response regulator transcription factor [Clostridium tertium]MDB1953823.1 response regulator transcription factor [Clostridium tertium]MDB1960465.1 response regulator transcription factor [Clostridium tertium]MDB1964209.1 response regulator transcription factor [Clostridium tertium]MDB1965431.1 response regulator transcription factor [Clostridium tertium]
MYKIIIIEDSESIREELKTYLERYGYEVEAPDSFENIIEYIDKSNASLILLDINLPLYDGYYICREVRKKSDVPIIVVTSRDSQVDELMSINLGADDFITKPYNTEILIARVSAILKRSYGKSSTDEVIYYGDLKLNLANGSISYKSNTIELTKNELKILTYLIKNKGKIVSRDALMDTLWQSDLFLDDNTLSVNVTRLRKKIEEIGLKNIIETRRGLGYIIP